MMWRARLTLLGMIVLTQDVADDDDDESEDTPRYSHRGLSKTESKVGLNDEINNAGNDEYSVASTVVETVPGSAIIVFEEGFNQFISNPDLQSILTNLKRAKHLHDATETRHKTAIKCLRRTRNARAATGQRRDIGRT